MRVAIVTGSGGLVGSESVRALVEAGFHVVGLENDTRAQLFGSSASTAPQTERLLDEHAAFTSLSVDIRDTDGVARVFAKYRRQLELVVHTAAQPSHDWAASQPQVDFGINANGTLNLLEATRKHAPEATFVFTSTNKVYGDTPNRLPLVELDTRLELPVGHDWFGGIDASMSIDSSMHSLFGVSKVAADLLVQEYGRYFDLPTVCFRCGCLTGPAHAGTELHGFLSYLMRCTIAGTPYTVHGYGGKQVRDNLASVDLVRAFLHFHAQPRAGAVYNLGGGRLSNCSMLEAIASCEKIAGRSLDWQLGDEARLGDHRWWISDLSAFQADYPGWTPTIDTDGILQAIHDANVDRWASPLVAA
jgi:CDP-paratose 2-epimerase